MRTYQNFYVDGRFSPCSGSESAALISPLCEEVIGEVKFCSRGDTDLAIGAARSALGAWATSGLDERRAALRQLRIEVEKRKEEFVSVLADELGCPVWLGRMMQVPMALRGIELAIEGIDQINWVEKVGNGRVELVPVGVVGAITPWNFPIHQMVAKVAASIASGCTLVLKPSEITPGAGMLLAESLHACNLPAGVVNMVWGGSALGQYLVVHPGIDHISFTGSTDVGRRIMAAAAEGLTSLTLELGGKSAAVMLDDADLSVALPNVARMCFANSGQTCVSQSRLVVPSTRTDEVVSRLQELMPLWPVGDPKNETTRIGPVASAAQFQRVTGFIEGALRDGARLGFGGVGASSQSAKGYFIAPTVFFDVKADMEIATKEVFGPVLAIIGYEDEEEAAAIANASPYGLSGAVWSKDTLRALRFAQGMNTGQVIVNGASQNLATPFGGRKASGFGRENGRFGIEDLLTHRSVHLDDGPAL